MVQQVEATLEQYELMIRGVLQAGHVYRRSPDFDDYRQELRLMIAERLMAGETLTAQHNNELFRWLHGACAICNGDPSAMRIVVYRLVKRRSK